MKLAKVGGLAQGALEVQGFFQTLQNHNRAHLPSQAPSHKQDGQGTETKLVVRSVVVVRSYLLKHVIVTVMFISNSTFTKLNGRGGFLGITAGRVVLDIHGRLHVCTPANARQEVLEEDECSPERGL